MGWEEGKGLGPQLQGISAPIEVSKRNAQEGLREGEVKGPALDRWRGGDAEGSSDEESAESVEDQTPKEPGWKKSDKKPKQKFVVAPTQPSAAAPKQIIVDMTGPQVRVLSSLDSAGKPSDHPTQPTKPKFLPELQHNITRLVDMKSSRMHTIDIKRRHEEQQLQSLKREEASLQHKMTVQGTIQIVHARHDPMLTLLLLLCIDNLIARLQDIQKILRGCRDRLEADYGLSRPSSAASGAQGAGLNLEFVAKVFELLKGKFGREYKRYRLEAIGYHLVFPLISRKFKDWNPLTHPEFGIAMLKSWRKIFEDPIDDNVQDVMEQDNEEFEEDFFGRKTRTSRQEKKGEFDLYNRLLAEVVIPKFRNTILAEWNPKDASALIAVLVSWSQILPAQIQDVILAYVSLLNSLCPSMTLLTFVLLEFVDLVFYRVFKVLLIRGIHAKTPSQFTPGSNLAQVFQRRKVAQHSL